MEISLSPQVEKLVEQQLKTGRFASANEVVETAVIELARHEKGSDSNMELDDLRAQIASGLSELDRGEGAAWDIDEIRTEGQRMLDGNERAKKYWRQTKTQVAAA